MRFLVIVAVVAALSGAPSSVFAAANQLSAPQVSPGSGSVTTVFTFRVRYDGTFAATSVTVSVAGLSLPMVPESGSLSAGWWTAASLLPVGAWSTSFQSTAARGPSSTVSGPVVVVAAPTTAPAPSDTPTPPGQGPTPESAPVGAPGGGSTGTAAPDAAPDEAASTTTPAPAPESGPVPPASTPPGGSGPSSGGGTVAAPGGGEEDASTEQSPEGGNAPAASNGAAPSAADGTTRMQTAGDGQAGGEPTSADERVSWLILIGLAGVASVAIVGTLLLMVGRRREPEHTAASATSPVAAVVERPRIARGGRARPAEDPILAALGVDDEMAARRAARRARSGRTDDAPAPVRPRRR